MMVECRTCATEVLVSGPTVKEWIFLDLLCLNNNSRHQPQIKKKKKKSFSNITSCLIKRNKKCGKGTIMLMFWDEKYELFSILWGYANTLVKFTSCVTFFFFFKIYISKSFVFEMWPEYKLCSVMDGVNHKWCKKKSGSYNSFDRSMLINQINHHFLHQRPGNLRSCYLFIFHLRLKLDHYFA